MDLKKVFLSSTAKDLEACREEASKAIHRLEGYHCVRMEDFGARDSAPIEVCIKKVQECDVFVGIVGHLYGSCPKGGDKSYTELEYEAAFSTNKPRIMLLSSADFPIYADQIEDPDRQEHQKRFRSRVAQDRCRQEFSKPYEVAPGVMAGLHNLEVDSNEASTDMAVSVKPTAEGGTASPALAPGVPAQAMQDEVSRQRLEAIDATRQSLATQPLDSSAPGGHILSNFDVARVFLTAKTLFSRHCSRESLSVHEANVLYAHREKLRAGGWERELLWETLLGEHEGIVPGWYWFKDLPAESLAQYLWFLAFQGSEEEVRTIAMVLLKKAAIPMRHSGVEEKDLFAAMLADKSSACQNAFFDYVSEHGAKEHLKLIDDALGNGNAVIPDAAIKARWRILARTAPETLFEELLQRTEPASEFVSLIRPIVQHLSETSLVKGTSHAAKVVRQLSVEELVKRNRLTKETAYGFLNDKSLRIREICIRHLIGLGETFEPEKIRETLKPAKASDKRSPLFGYLKGEGVDVDAGVYHLFKPLTYDSLVEHVEWLDLNGHIAYKVLAELHFGKMAARIRSDLDDNFESLHRQHVQGLGDVIRKQVIGGLGRVGEGEVAMKIVDKKAQDAVLVLLKREEDITEFIRSHFVAAALAGLAKNGEASDISYARKLLLQKAGEYYGDIQVQAIKLIQRFGNREDIDSLLEIAQKAFGELKTLAINTVLRLSPGIDGCARKLLTGNDADSFRLAVDSLGTAAWADVKPLLVPYLVAEDNRKRLDVLRCFARRCEPAELEALLQEYMSQGRYFYNVVCWLDRILFAPPPLKEAYLQDLLNG